MYQVLGGYGDDALRKKLAKKYPITSSDGNIIKPEDAFVGNFGKIEAITSKSLPNWIKMYDEIKKTDMWKNKQVEVDKVNQTITKHLNETKTVYRGTNFDEIEAIVENDGEVGHHERETYAERMDFLSTSIDENVTEKFATNVTITFDVSDMKENDVSPMNYEYRGQVLVSDTPGGEINPFEKFGGTQSVRHIHQFEVQLRKGSKPKIKRITVSGSEDEYKKRVESIKKRLGYDFTVKYG